MKSARCQKKDWKTHKFNCSALAPADGVPPATKIEVDEEFRSEIARLTVLVETIAQGIRAAADDPEHKGIPASLVRPLLCEYW